jgi:integrase
VLSWALDRGLIAANPCEKGGRLYRGNRADKVWTEEDEANFLSLAPHHMHLPFLLAVWTAQRQGDLLRLPWSSYDGKKIRLTQRKSIRKGDESRARRVVVPVGARLKAALDEAAKCRKGPLILVSSEGRPWTPDGFRSSWRKACAKAGVAGVTFHDLRGTAVTRLALAGATESEIAYISGHTLGEVRSILDAHYLNRDQKLGEKGIQKLERGTDFTN